MNTVAEKMLESVKINVSGAPIVVQSAAKSPEADKYVWYLCVQETPLKWSCAETTKEEALNPFQCSAKQTMAIPISKFSPRASHRFQIRCAVSPDIDMK